MKKYLIKIILLLVIFVGCNKEENPFQIAKQNVGLLTDSTQVKDLESVFINDSIVKYKGDSEFTGDINNIEIFNKDGKKTLVLSPNKINDSTAVISNVNILDSNYKTDKNISILSTFKDIQNNYKISRIDNLINSVVVTVNDINATFTIDKKELPANLRFDMKLKIEATHIPDGAKIKYFFINWN
ncbi:hypothetical protein RXV94_07320 [Yeosuana sp. MJ-SS3]|uniref:Lipoprotein n=1 Tax=Gilvirhabdus luticola TaxID=3079858 RepID=A0ABU3U6F7_9FLAO|nr:hypothetical protein [Yeosuana sp. MJ-SS3]MDU8885966.1 hypothetical protein [Yeosuana sp. MJ-SS3]